MKVRYLLFLLLLIPAWDAWALVRGTVHDFVTRFPQVATTGETEPCRFCHQAHGAGFVRVPAPIYSVYMSATLRSVVEQPNGSSRQCLVCHDGTRDLGSLWSSVRGRELLIGPLRGKASLGMDLSDDHPVSFVYDRILSMRKGRLADPGILPRGVRLDAFGRLQCTTCHDPHANRYPKFLVMENSLSQVCTSCHRFQGTALPHSASQIACQDCHRVHNAGRRQWLLGPR